MGRTIGSKGQLPNWKDEVFDPQVRCPCNKPRCPAITRIFSLGNYTVLGDYMDEMLTVKESEYPGVQQRT